MAPVPESPYDLTTYWGRVQDIAQSTNPFLLLRATGDSIAQAEKTVEEHQNTFYAETSASASPTPEQADRYWKARYLLASCKHPDTGEIVHPTGRFCAFVPMNIPILAVMLHPYTGTNPALMSAAMIANQSYNSWCNFSNRNASMPVDYKKMAISYFGSVGVACGMSLAGIRFVDGLERKAAAAGGGGGARIAMMRISVPFVASVAASVLNMSFMRSADLLQGIPVRNKATGEFLNNREPSTAAGRSAVSQVAVSRAMVVSLLMLPPPLIMHYLTKKFNLAAKPARVGSLINLGLISAIMPLAIPLSLAVYAQTAELPLSALEDSFNTEENKSTTETVIFNKGL